MAYELANPIKRIAGGIGGAPTLWFYEDGDALTAADASGYFNLDAARLKVGDRIFMNAVIGGSVTYGEAVVLSNTRDLTASPPVEGVVDTSNFSGAAGAIDSD
jgi:hypothetical protein